MILAHRVGDVVVLDVAGTPGTPGEAQGSSGNEGAGSARPEAPSGAGVFATPAARLAAAEREVHSTASCTASSTASCTPGSGSILRLS